jgi:glycosyltransferase involved in cell wall biosynthesis
MSMPKIERQNQLITEEKINEFQPDLIFLWSQLRLTLGCAYTAENSEIPCVYSFNDEWLRWYCPVQLNRTLKRLIKYIFLNKLFRIINASQLKLQNCFSISECTHVGIAAEVTNLKTKRIIYQGVHLADFPFSTPREQISNTVKLLYVGQLYEDKGLSTIGDALKALESKGDFSLTIVGDGPPEYIKKLKEMCSTLKTQVTFTGKLPRTQLPQIYSLHDIFIFPSICREAFGLTHLEAMACGLPVISSLSGGQREFLKDGVNSLTFNAGNHLQLAAQISTLVQNNNLRLDLIANGRKEIEENFNTKRYFNEIHEYLINST